jgi:hypothetical protein
VPYRAFFFDEKPPSRRDSALAVSVCPRGTEPGSHFGQGALVLTHRFSANDVIARAIPLLQCYWEPSRALGSMPSAAAILCLDCLEGGCLPRSNSATSACDNPAARARARCVSPRSLLKSTKRRGEKSVEFRATSLMNLRFAAALDRSGTSRRIGVQGGKLGIGANRSTLRIPGEYRSPRLYGIAFSPRSLVFGLLCVS